MHFQETLFPSYTIGEDAYQNIPAVCAPFGKKAAIMEDPGLAEQISMEEERLRGEGRILVRPSGTESLIRVMVEGKDPALAEECAQNLADYIKNIGKHKDIE